MRVVIAALIALAVAGWIMLALSAWRGELWAR